MTEFHVFDCTLSEGGFAIKWVFYYDNIKGILSGLSECGTEYIDVGILRNEYSTKHRTLISGGRLLRLLLQNCGKRRYSATVTIDKRTLPINNYVRFIPQGMDFSIRVKFDRWHIEGALQYCESLLQHGIPVIIDPIDCAKYTPDEFRCMAERFARFAPRAFFVSDDNGIYRPEDVLPYLFVVRDLFPQSVMIAYRGRGATGKTLKHLLAGTDFDGRSFLIEGAVCGLGSKYVNAKSEKIAWQINSRGNGTYALQKYADLVDRYLKGACSSIGSLTVTDTLVKELDSSKKYLGYYRSIGLGDTEIMGCLKELERKKYSYENAEQVLRSNRTKYWKQRLGVIVPTCNRPETIRFWLEFSGKRLWQYGVDLIIYDSSTDDKTKEITYGYIHAGYRNIKYVPYTGYYDGKSLDHKLIEAYKRYADTYEYIWLIRDGIAIAWDYFNEQLRYRFDRGDDLIVVDSDWRDIWGTGIQRYTRPEKLFEDQGIRMVTLGTMIVKSSFMMDVIEKIPVDDTNYSLWQMISVFQYYTDHRVRASSYTGNVFVYNPSGTISSFWNTNGKALWQWAERWYEVIHSLPDIYDAKKKKVYKIDMYDFHPFSIHTLALIKANNGLRVRDVNHYKPYFKYVHDRPIWQYYALALAPIPHHYLKDAIMHPESRSYRFINKCAGGLRGVYRKFFKRSKE